MHRAAASPAASSVDLARSPRVGVPSIPRVVSGGWAVCAGVIRTVSDACFGGACWGVHPRESCDNRWGWGGAGTPVVVCPSWVWVVAFAVVPFSSVPRSPLLPLPGSWVVSCHHVVSLLAPCPYWCLFALNGAFCGWPGRGERLLRAKLFRGGAGARNQVQSRAEYRCTLLSSSASSQRDLAAPL